MKKLLLIVLLPLFSIACSQNKSSDYSNEVKDLKAYVENVYKNDLANVKGYVKNENNGKIFPIKTDDIFSEFDFEFYYVYEFLRKDDKVIYARKAPISQSGDSSIFYDYYFSKDGRLIGAEKSVSSFYGENSEVVSYTIEYELSDKTDKLERLREIYTDENDKKIEKNSKLYKEAIESGLMSSYIEDLDKITFRDLEGFMNVEKIKYYTDSENLTDKEKESRLLHSNNQTGLFGKEILKKFTFVENYMDSIEINKKLNDEIYIEIESSKKIIKIKREKLSKKRYNTIFDLYKIGQYDCISEIPTLDNGLFMKLNRFYDETGQLFSLTEVDGIVNEEGEKITMVSRFCLLKNKKNDSETKKLGLLSRKYYKNDTEINNVEFDFMTKNFNLKSYSERFGKIDRNVLSDYQNQRDEKNKKIVKYSTVGMQTLLNLIVK